MKENWADRNKLCIYDEEMQAAPLVHFPTDSDKKYDTRMLIYFYAFLFFQDWNQDLWMKVRAFCMDAITATNCLTKGSVSQQHLFSLCHVLAQQLNSVS